MKNKTLLFVLILVSSFGFSQNKISRNNSISGIDIIVKKESASKPIKNTENNHLITKINKLEFKYLNLTAKKMHHDFKTDFYRIEGHMGKANSNKVFKAYIKYLRTYKTPGVYVEEIVKFPPVIKKVNTTGKRTNVKDAHDKYAIDLITKRNPANQPITNIKNIPLIAEINKLEIKYLNLKIKEVQQNFAKKDLSKLKTKNEVLKAYVDYFDDQDRLSRKKYRRVSERLRHK